MIYTREIEITVAGRSSMIAPAGAYALDGTVWGASGAGNAQATASYCNSGGAGACAQTLGLAVVGGQTRIFFLVGKGATGVESSQPTSNGEASWFNVGTNVQPASAAVGAMAAGGQSATGFGSTNYGMGGQASASIGATKHSGGNGCNGAYGCGGGAAGPDGDGTAGTTASPGLGNSGGGDGGVGAVTGAAESGHYPGGGGGSKQNTTAGALSGSGANGKLVLKFYFKSPAFNMPMMGI